MNEPCTHDKWMRVWNGKLILKCFHCGHEEDLRTASRSEAKRLESILRDKK